MEYFEISNKSIPSFICFLYRIITRPRAEYEEVFEYKAFNYRFEDFMALRDIKEVYATV